MGERFPKAGLGPPEPEAFPGVSAVSSVPAVPAVPAVPPVPPVSGAAPAGESAPPLATDHSCYLLRGSGGATYVGYTVDPARRLRQHNGELAGGAKKTARRRPWAIVCVVSGFRTQSSALRFEWRWQRTGRQRTVAGRLAALEAVVAAGDGALAWPALAVSFAGACP